ncbi:MAG: M20/M25/M40 family metallo-hydrolase, partial [Solirubrobacteraceae bacterium]
LVTRASETERRRLHETFATLCRIESPTGSERACADWITSELRSIGLEVSEDGAGSQTGSDAGNLYALIPGDGPNTWMMCAHMDTVPLTAPVDPVLRDGGWENANPGILGADNKAAAAVLIELARRLKGADVEPATGVELVFTVCEENGLHGAKAFDVARLRSRLGYVFDHAGPLGEIVVASPTYQRVDAAIRGKAAHAGIRPQDGVSAIAAAAKAVATIPLGRLDAGTTVNVGTISGGTARNVVPDLCRLEGEVRGLDEQRLESVLTEVIDALQEAADRGTCDLDLSVQRLFSGYRAKPGEPAVRLARRALDAIGYEPRLISSGGGSDANAFRRAGFECVCLANGTERNHEPGERVSVQALESSLDLAIALVDHAGQETAEAIAQ